MDKKTVGIVACSNALSNALKSDIQKLTELLEKIELRCLMSRCIFEKDGSFSGNRFQRAEELIKMYKNSDVADIFDISGGDMANEILYELDYEIIKQSNTIFWGYSDLTTIINALYAKIKKASVLYQVRNLIGPCSEIQQKRFVDLAELFDIKYHFIQGIHMEGVVVGGNIRCFLKLAGTEYFPDLTDKILLLEARGGEVPQMVTFLSQLKQLGAFKKVKGILLGTFTMMEKNQCSPDIITLVKEYAGEAIPIAKTEEIGHGADSKAIMIGEYKIFE